MFNLYNPNSQLNLILKVAGKACNLDCTYCFEKKKLVSSDIMEIDTLKDIISKIHGICSVTFHGGEPLLVGKKMFARYLDLLEKEYPAKVNMIRIQSNGTLLDEDWIELFYSYYKRLNIEIAFSLDGYPNMNGMRVDYNGKNTYDKVRNAYVLLEKNRKYAGLLSVISKNCIYEDSSREYVKFLDSIPNLSFVKLNPLFNMSGKQLALGSITPLQFAEFVLNVAKWHIKMKLYKRIAIEPILSILQRLHRQPSRYCNFSERKCYNYLSVYPDGTLGPCDCLAPSTYPVGCVSQRNDINLEETLSHAAQGVGDLLSLKEKCQACDISLFCHAGCLSQRAMLSVNDNLSAEYCEARHFLYNEFSSLLKTFKKL